MVIRWFQAKWSVVIVLPRKDGSGEVERDRARNDAGWSGTSPAVKLVEGRWFTPGQREVVVSKSIHKRFYACQRRRHCWSSAKGRGQVVGVFDAGGMAYESEIWGDVNQMTSDFDRQGVYSSAYLRATDAVSAEALKNRVSDDQRLKLDGMLETGVLRDANQFRCSHSDSSAGWWRSIMAIGSMFRGHEHDVCRGSVPIARDCDAARDRIFAAQHSDFVRARSAAAVAAGCDRRNPAHVAVQRHDHRHAEPGNVQRSGFRSADDAGRDGGGDHLCAC